MTKSSDPTPSDMAGDKQDSNPSIVNGNSVNHRQHNVRILGRIVVSFGKYLLIMVAVYLLMTWWRGPTMPVAPVWQLTDTSGQTHDILALSHDQPVMLYFWGSWCGVCGISSPRVQTLYDTKPDGASNYPILSIAVQSGDNSQIAEYLHKHQLSFPVINDADGRLFAAWQGQVTPSYVIIKDGDMVQGWTGVQPVWMMRTRLWLADKLPVF